jgi:hypothetical protein
MNLLCAVLAIDESVPAQRGSGSGQDSVAIDRVIWAVVAVAVSAGAAVP